jgi:hypothetical protein
MMINDPAAMAITKPTSASLRTRAEYEQTAALSGHRRVSLHRGWTAPQLMR